MKPLRDLWAGRLPLHEVLWTWAVARGAALNVGCTLAALTIWLRQDSGPWAVVALVIQFLPVPYNVAFAVGAWRSAGQPGHSPARRAAARAVALGLCVLYIAV